MKTRYMMSGGLAFDEEKDMLKLSKLAKNGWMIERFTFMGYILKKSESRNLQFAIDYRADADDEYFNLFQESGWTHIDSEVGYIHLFCAEPEASPIFTDRMSVQDKYENEKGKMKKGTIWTFAFTVFLSVLLYYITNSSSLSASQPFVIIVLTILLILMLVALVFTGLPYLAYLYKIYKLKS